MSVAHSAAELVRATSIGTARNSLARDMLPSRPFQVVIAGSALVGPHIYSARALGFRECPLLACKCYSQLEVDP